MSVKSDQPGPTFMELDGVKGSSEVEGFKNLVAIESHQKPPYNDTGGSYGSELPSGNIVANSDPKATPTLFQKAGASNAFKTMKIYTTVREDGAKLVKKDTFTYTNITVTAFEQSGDYMLITFTADSIAEDEKIYDKMGKPAGNQSRKYDFVKRVRTI